MKPNEFDYINRTYGLSMSRGSRVEYTGDKSGPKQGVVTSAAGAHVNIRFDGETKSIGPFHPTWELRQIIVTDDQPAA
ncbi:MAG: hypothetical protein EOO12_00055 [Chitinophagaceae bacterium]|nr:MAG: hypothetical protein EOO12_00055 [Chitinophagaceae bacterium]